MREGYSENGYAGLFESCAHGMGAEIPKQDDTNARIIEAFGQVVDRRDLLRIAGSYEATKGTGLFWKRVADFAGQRIDDGDSIIPAPNEKRFAVLRRTPVRAL
jgi:hypothetical protein